MDSSDLLCPSNSSSELERRILPRRLTTDICTPPNDYILFIRVSRDICHPFDFSPSLSLLSLLLLGLSYTTSNSKPKPNFLSQRWRFTTCYDQSPFA